MSTAKCSSPEAQGQEGERKKGRRQAVPERGPQNKVARLQSEQSSLTSAHRSLGGEGGGSPACLGLSSTRKWAEQYQTGPPDLKAGLPYWLPEGQMSVHRKNPEGVGAAL